MVLVYLAAMAGIGMDSRTDKVWSTWETPLPPRLTCHLPSNSRMKSDWEMLNTSVPDCGSSCTCNLVWNVPENAKNFQPQLCKSRRTLATDSKNGYEHVRTITNLQQLLAFSCVEHLTVLYTAENSAATLVVCQDAVHQGRWRICCEAPAHCVEPIIDSGSLDFYRVDLWFHGRIG
jgi:hypothetical protein